MAVALAPAPLWLAAISALPHKEERFLYVIYPLVRSPRPALPYPCPALPSHCWGAHCLLPAPCPAPSPALLRRAGAPGRCNDESGRAGRGARAGRGLPRRVMLWWPGRHGVGAVTRARSTLRCPMPDSLVSDPGRARLHRCAWVRRWPWRRRRPRCGCWARAACRAPRCCGRRGRRRAARWRPRRRCRCCAPRRWWRTMARPWPCTAACQRCAGAGSSHLCIHGRRWWPDVHAAHCMELRPRGRARPAAAGGCVSLLHAHAGFG